MEKKKKSSSGSYLCIAPIFSACVPKQSSSSSNDAAGRNNRLSFSFFPGGGGNGNGKPQPQPQPPAEDPNSESIIDPAASVIARKDKDNKDGRHQQQHCGVIVGTIFGRRTGHVTFCVQRDAAAPPPFLFELAVPMQSLAAEIGSGLLRIALECHRGGGSGSNGGDRNVWRATCNGRDVGHAVRRRPTDCDRRVLETMKAMTSGVGVLPPAPAVEREGEDGVDGGGACGEVLYMRATYERVVGSRDAVSYHLISPGGGGSSPQELSVFLLRTRAD